MTDALVREFLLGELADEERERIENLFLTDPPTRDRVLTSEQELIEDYLEDNLSEADKKRFVARYAQTYEQRRNLRITKSIQAWAVAQAGEPQTAAATVSGWSRFWTRFRFKPVFAIPVAVMILIAVVLAIVWLNSRMERRKHLALEQELAQLNSAASLREIPPHMVSYELRPIAVRSAEQQAVMNRRSDIQILELQLPWIPKERYTIYVAEVRRADNNQSFSIRNLQPDNHGEYKIRVRLPTHILRRGSYQIQLRGIDEAGSISRAEEYYFAVSE